MFKRLKLQSNQWMILVLAVMWALLLLYANFPMPRPSPLASFQKYPADNLAPSYRHFISAS